MRPRKSFIFGVIALLLVAAEASAQEYAVISNDTWIHREPGSKTPRFQPDTGDGWITVEKIGDRKGWTQVRFNHIPSDRRCYGALWALRDIRLDAWVRTDDLATVTLEKVTSRFEDGTSVTLNPGVVVKPRNRGDRYDAFTAGHVWPAKLDPTAVGTSFPPTPIFTHPNGSYRVAKNNFIVGGEPIAKSKGSGYSIRREVEIDGTTRYRLGWTCASAMVLGEFEAPDKGGGGMGLLGALTGGGDYQYAPKGTSVYWRGTEVGVTLRDYPLREAEQDGQRLCKAVGEKMPGGSIRLCFDVDDLEQRTAGASSVAGLLSGDQVRDIDDVLKKTDDLSGMSPAVTRRIVQQRRAQIDACYHAAAKKAGPALGPKVTVEFWVDEHGGVTTSKFLSSELEDDEAKACILRVIDGLIFPAKKGREPHKIRRTFSFGRD